MEDRRDISVAMPGELVERIEARLGYGDSKSAWIREACRQRLEREAEAEEGNPNSPPATM